MLVSVIERLSVANSNDRFSRDGAYLMSHFSKQLNNFDIITNALSALSLTLRFDANSIWIHSIMNRTERILCCPGTTQKSKLEMTVLICPGERRMGTYGYPCHFNSNKLNANKYSPACNLRWFMCVPRC